NQWLKRGRSVKNRLNQHFPRYHFLISSREFVLMIAYCFFKRIEPRAPLMWGNFNKKRSELPCEFSYRVPF
ncbi:hypothetical protein PO883_34245, partial [Massilia sp. DJPM01]|uniref:hypothetical protein n=1 Tax=Massilia sp. DJPM01 TaxID=3024404 RepID=UPI00259DCA5C